jgi:hypothetical protein
VTWFRHAAIAPFRQPLPVITLAKPAAYHRSRAGIRRAITDGESWPLVAGAGSDPRRGGAFTGTSAKSSWQAAAAGRTTPVV